MKPIRKAVFPVAGLGTRFLPATKAMPKEMLTVVDRPLIQHVVDEAREAGIEHFVFVTGRNKGVIEDHFDLTYELERTLAERGRCRKLAISPKNSPGPKKASTSGAAPSMSRTTSTRPETMMKKAAPTRPSRTIALPAGKVSSRVDRATSPISCGAPRRRVSPFLWWSSTPGPGLPRLWPTCSIADWRARVSATAGASWTRRRASEWPVSSAPF